MGWVALGAVRHPGGRRAVQIYHGGGGGAGGGARSLPRRGVHLSAV